MTHVSKRALPRDELELLQAQFSKTISTLSRSDTNFFLKELLGPEELTMLAKRLAVIILFTEGNSSYRVWNTLNISPSTADRIKLQYECGAYKHIVAAIRKDRTNLNEFWDVLEIILRAGLPPRTKERWKSVFRK